MSELAKKSREAMKSKARRLAGEVDRKTDSSDWTPASPLNSHVKTGMRPVSKQHEFKAGGAVAKSRADRKPRKAGGRVEKEIGVGMANKNMKAANESREGKKHIGGMKTGGAASAGVKNKKALGAIDPSPKRNPAGHYKHGGKIKKADGGILDTIANALAGKGYIDGSTWLSKEEPMAASDVAAPAPTRRIKPDVDVLTPAQARRELAMGRQNMRVGRSGDDLTPAQARRELAMGRHNLALKKGGKVKRASGGSLPSPEEAMRSEERRGSVKIEEKRKLPAPKEAAESAARVGDVPEGHKKGGKAVRKGRKHGGAAPNLTVIVADKDRSAAPQGGMQPRATPAPLTPATPPAVPPMPTMQPPVMPPSAVPPSAQPPIKLRTGGRVAKVASSYKDMEAGSGSGEGRLQKTDIAKRYKDAPARKFGGRAVY